jgi:hypothetical protein
MAYLQGGVILPEVALYCTLCYIAGGSYSDVYFMAGISSASFYCILWKTMTAINSCEELSVNFLQTMEECNLAAEGFASISDQRCIGNCVSVIGSYHLRIQSCNFCVNERILQHGLAGIGQNDYEFSPHEQAMRTTVATYEFEEAGEMFDNPWLHTRDRMT